MTRRSCPKCKEVLGEYDYFFCSACGTKLPKELVREPHSIKVRTYLMYHEEDKFSLKSLISVFANKTLLSILGLLTFIGIVLFGISSTGVIELVSFNLFKSESIPEVKLPTRQDPTISLGTFYETGEFDEYAFVTYVPSNIDFYLDGFDVVGFSDYLVKDEDLVPFFSKAELLLKKNFAGYYTSEPSASWVYIFVPTDIDIVAKVLEDIDDDYWSFRIIDDLLFMVSDEAAFDQINQVTYKLEPSLALNPEYVKKIQDLPNNGQFRIIFLKEEIRELLKNSLGGLDQTIIGNINTVLLSEFDGVVIK